MSEFTPDDPIAMEYTKNAADVAALQKFSNEGTKRRLIGRDTPILNGMYGGAYGGETIVVDYDKEPGMYDYLAWEVKSRSTVDDGEGHSKIDKSLILDSVFQVTRERIAYSQPGVDEIFAVVGGREHQKIGLSVYMDQHVGVCRHQALLAGSLLERLGQEGVVSGQASVERSVQWPEDGDPGGHSWVRYTNSRGEVYILDPAQGFIGTLDEAMQRQKGWNYLRPEEDAERRRHTVAQQIVEAETRQHELIDGIPDHIKNPPHTPPAAQVA